LTAGGMSRHLPACRERQEVIERANQRPGDIEELYHLQIEDTASGDFWLHVEMRGSATMEDLDDYLRAIWLECCGHLSQFFEGDFWKNKIDMSAKLNQIMKPGDRFFHIYDFGTESRTFVTAVDVREDKPLTKHPIVLMARNDPPEFECAECGEPARWLCVECIYEEGAAGTLCDECVEGHPHEDYDEPFPIVNSPRLGMCGYTGPADPPY